MRKLAGHLGESLREVGILVGVFGPLYAIYDTKDGQAHSLHWWIISGFIACFVGAVIQWKAET